MSQETLPQKMGLLVRRLRTEAGYSQERFAFACGMHRTYIGAIERGEKSISIETASKLAKALGISLAALFQLLEEE